MAHLTTVFQILNPLLQERNESQMSRVSLTFSARLPLETPIYNVERVCMVTL